MKPMKLVLKGFRGIQDGLGRDVYELDLEGLGDARLVAIAGPNGKGKSTVLDNLHPFPILPSRATSYSVSAFSMYEHIVAPEALKELDWEYRGFNGDGAGLDEAMLDDGYTHLDTVYHLLADLIDHGGYYNEAGRVAAQQFVDVMVK